MPKKSEELVQDIIDCSDRDNAIQVLNDTLESLHLSSNYSYMVKLRDKLDEFSERYQGIVKNYTSDITDYHTLSQIRTELNFLYQEVTDELTAEVNQLKILTEESKTVKRAKAIERLENSELAHKLNAKSATALRDIVGYDEKYQEFVNEISIAYGNYKKLENLLNSIRMMIDNVSSHQHRERVIMQKEPK